MHRPRLPFRQAPHIVLGLLARERRLVHGGGADGEGNPRLAQDFGAARRLRGEHQHFLSVEWSTMKHLAQELAIAPDSKIKLAKIDPEDTHGVEKSKAAHHLKSNLERLSVLQYLLYAEAKRALLVVLQGIDAGGKDGTIRHVMSGLNPQGVVVTPFKVPEGAEKRHDYLWRVHNAVPEQGAIGIFNRSHYEDVLVVRVHSLVPKPVW